MDSTKWSSPVLCFQEWQAIWDFWKLISKTKRQQLFPVYPWHHVFTCMLPLKMGICCESFVGVDSNDACQYFQASTIFLKANQLQGGKRSGPSPRGQLPISYAPFPGLNPFTRVHSDLNKKNCWLKYVQGNGKLLLDMGTHFLYVGKTSRSASP